MKDGMQKIGMTVALWALFWVSLVAQDFHAVTHEAEQRQLQTQFEQAFAFTSFQAQFVQTKQSDLLAEPVKSTGQLYMTPEGGFRIEYQTPVPFAFWTDGHKAYNQQKGAAPRSVNTQNKRFAQMASLFQGGVLNPALFTLSFEESAEQVCCLAVPKQAQLKNMYTAFRLYLPQSSAQTVKNGKLPVIEKLIIQSARKSEVSCFEFHHVQLNAPLPASLFSE